MGTIYAGGRNPLVYSLTNRLCGTEHLSQSPGLGLRGREEELRLSAMLEWIFSEARSDGFSSCEDGMDWI